jgi:hypothetical protein
VKGRIDSRQGEPVESVLIAIEGLNTKAISDVNGNFDIECQSACILIFSHINYQTKYLNISTSQYLEIILDEKENILHDVEVKALSTSENVIVTLNQIKSHLAVFGENDVIKYLTTLPGVSSINTFDAGISVRGGSTIAAPVSNSKPAPRRRRRGHASRRAFPPAEGRPALSRLCGGSRR